MTSPGEGGKLSFARDIRPLFRAKDRDSMRSAFDLFGDADVAGHAGDIVGSCPDRGQAGSSGTRKVPVT
jgi:hypothetical protein